MRQDVATIRLKLTPTSLITTPKTFNEANPMLKNFDCKKCWNNDPASGCRLFSVVPVHHSCGGYLPLTAQKPSKQEMLKQLLPTLRSRAQELSSDLVEQLEAETGRPVDEGELPTQGEWISALLFAVTNDPLAKKVKGDIGRLKRFIRGWEPSDE